ncbi:MULTISPECIES: hypothetical protein [Vibrio]|uniref:hypothetical protein n=1 Tax=Vibrio TaxID=662 RepID=UPI000690AC44|nr:MULTISPECIES: hypothetical protein [Vibrio]EGQ7696218.1 hypothetical protein [Vibrio vulnificus]EJG1475296.1 hypothetical protein [Vibrio parahaemolyticus]EKA7408104.1 hypothetical protein [Vibrio parahaemolyticus]EKG9660749.1 hypothetical protein [Vibrio parahaemolyticus]EKL9850726.1 hypothetical protein [Vibrio parahaemolyticus]
MNKWVCDTCGHSIEKQEDGWVEWISFSEGKVGRNLRLVHSFSSSPQQVGRVRCQFDGNLEYKKDGGIVGDCSLSDLTGPDGLMRLLVFISENELPKDEVLEMIKRIHIPGYEDTRLHFEQAIRAGAFEPNMPKDFYNQSDINATKEFLRSLTTDA